MKALSVKLAVFFLMMSPTLAFGHEGHGTDPTIITHYLLSPAHLLPSLLILGGILFFVIKFIRKKATDA